jgi:high-affinity iron transporter
MAAIVLSFREALEAVLIIGIVLGYLAKAGEMHRARSVWAGVVAACAVSVALSLLLFSAGAEMEGQAEALFEGATMLLAAIVLTWMIFWMQSHSGDIKNQVAQRLHSAPGDAHRWGLFSLAFLSVIREGIELSLFLTAAMFTSSPLQTALGAVIGIGGATIVGWAVFSGTRRLDVQRFFSISGLVLLVFAAGLVGSGLAEMHEAGILPAIVAHVWSTRHILSEQSTIGALFKALLGYSDSPSLLQVLGYAAYAAVTLTVITMRQQALTVRRQSPKLP